MDAFNLGNGYENVYTATPDVTAADGTVTPGVVTDTLVTPYGNTNLDSLFGGINAANPLQPGDAFTGLEAGDSSMILTPSVSAALPSTPSTRPEPKALTLSPRPSVYHRC